MRVCPEVAVHLLARALEPNLGKVMYGKIVILTYWEDSFLIMQVVCRSSNAT